MEELIARIDSYKEDQKMGGDRKPSTKKDEYKEETRETMIGLLKHLKREIDTAIEETKAGGGADDKAKEAWEESCLLYTSPSPRDGLLSRMPSSA